MWACALVQKRVGSAESDSSHLTVWVALYESLYATLSKPGSTAAVTNARLRLTGVMVWLLGHLYGRLSALGNLSPAEICNGYTSSMTKNPLDYSRERGEATPFRTASWCRSYAVVSSMVS